MLNKLSGYYSYIIRYLSGQTEIKHKNILAKILKKMAQVNY